MIYEPAKLLILNDIEPAKLACFSIGTIASERNGYPSFVCGHGHRVNCAGGILEHGMAHNYGCKTGLKDDSDYSRGAGFCKVGNIRSDNGTPCDVGLSPNLF